MSLVLDNSLVKNKNRGRLEIVKDVLSIALVRVRKTKIMYQANLSYAQLERYRRMLLEQGLVGCHGDSCYLTTWKGKKFLQMYADYLERIKKISDDVNGVLKHRLQLENMCFNECNSKRMTNRKEIVL